MILTYSPCKSEVSVPYCKDSSAQAEIDLVLEGPRQEVLAIEVRRTLAPTVSKGFRLGCEETGATQRYYVVPEGRGYPLDSQTEAIPLAALLQVFAELK